MITDVDLQHWFSYHPPESEEQLRAYQAIRDAGHEFSKVLLDNTPSSADQSAAIRHVRLAVMQANAAIACKGR